MSKNIKYVKIFTDGACKGNPGPGGWGAILNYSKHKKEICGSSTNTTNNVIFEEVKADELIARTNPQNNTENTQA